MSESTDVYAEAQPRIKKPHSCHVAFQISRDWRFHEIFKCSKRIAPQLWFCILNSRSGEPNPIGRSLSTRSAGWAKTGHESFFHLMEVRKSVSDRRTFARCIYWLVCESDGACGFFPFLSFSDFHLLFCLYLFISFMFLYLEFRLANLFSS